MSDVTTTDLYEVTMALSYLHEDMSESATFSLFVRDLPAERGFLVSAGTEPALEYLSAFRITSADVGDFASALHRPYADVAGLCGITFTGEVRAVPEGRVVFAGEPLLEVTAPLAQAQLVETSSGGRLLTAPHPWHLGRDAGRSHHGARGVRGDQ